MPDTISLVPHTIVRLTDGSIGQVLRVVDDEVLVVHHDRWLGAGPWFFPLSSVTEATDEEAWAYAERVTAHRLRMAPDAPVVEVR